MRTFARAISSTARSTPKSSLPARRAAEDLPGSVHGIGPITVHTLIAALPELGRIGRRHRAVRVLHARLRDRGRPAEPPSSPPSASGS